MFSYKSLFNVVQYNNNILDTIAKNNTRMDYLVSPGRETSNLCMVGLIRKDYGMKVVVDRIYDLFVLLLINGHIYKESNYGVIMSYNMFK